MFTTENAEISDDFWKRRTRLYSSYYKRAFFIKASRYRRFGNDIVQSVSVIFHGAFRWLLLFTIKNHLCAGDYAATVCAITHAIKTRSNNPLRFLQRKNSIRRYLANDLTCAARKATFRTRKRFHNKQYPPKSKDQQPHGSDRTHFYVRFNKSNVAIHRQSFFFFFLTKSQPFNKKQPTGTINQIKQSEKTIPATIQSKTHKKTVKTNTKTISSINRKINRTNNHSKQSTQPLKKHAQNKHDIQSNNTPRFLNIKIIAG